jgi:[acyl-carrier-protein] S-malonyltransferase
MPAFAITFPGQGSQSVGMLSAYPNFPAIQTTLREASDVLALDFERLIAEGPAEELAKTINTQPVMLVADVALWRAWKLLGGPQPDFVAGHSLGEFAALVAAGSLTFSDALRLVRIRAEAMQAAVPEGVGAIAAVLGLDAEALQAACDEAAAGEVVQLANLNAPGQIVISGHKAAVERAIVAAKAKGAKRGVMLPMSVPAHSALMRPASDALANVLADVAIEPPTIPVMHNATVAPANDAATIRAALVQQVYSPVRWIESMTALGNQGVTTFVELGPGKVLTGMNSRIVPTARCFSTANAADLELAIAHFRA